MAKKKTKENNKTENDNKNVSNKSKSNKKESLKSNKRDVSKKEIKNDTKKITKDKEKLVIKNIKQPQKTIEKKVNLETNNNEITKKVINDNLEIKNKEETKVIEDKEYIKTFEEKDRTISNKNKKKIKKKTLTKIKNKNIPKKKPIKKTRKKQNKKIKIYYQVIILFIFLLILCIYTFKRLSPIPTIKTMYIDDNNYINIITDNIKENNKIYCYYSTEDKVPSYNDEKWVLVKDNTCSFKMENEKYYAYLKNENNTIVKIKDVEKLGKIISVKLDKEKVYLPINGTTRLNFTYEKIGTIDKTITWTSDDEERLKVKDGYLTAIKEGNVKVSASIMGKTASAEIIITNLITKRPNYGFDFNKPNLGCKKYTQEQNDLLDEILKSRISDAGYKTRAGAVEAARFLTLDFPYRINYFYENGRQTTNNVDGEGRYYHVGMYLHESRFKNITGSQKGPAIWGCSMYDRPIKKQNSNGLDCSGFVSWALLNAGFDVKDVGAGWSNNLDLTDYGTVKKVNTTLINSNSIKVGDLLHSTDAGGHIGIIVAMDQTYYYVAQALWYDEVGVQITKIQKDKLYKTFPHAILMDKYYLKDGNLTNMW